MTKEQTRVLVTACMSHALIHIYELSVPALLILIQATDGGLNADDFQMGKVVTAYTAAFGLGSLPAGMLADRFGSKRLLVACLWGASFSLIGMALSSNLNQFAVFAFSMGLFLSIYHPAGTTLITHTIPISGKVFAYHGMVGNLGVSGSALLAGALGALLGWRGALGSLSILGLGLGLFACTLPAPSIHEVKKQTGDGRWPNLIVLLVAAAFMGMVYRGLTTFLPKYFSVAYDGGTALGGLFATLALLAGLAGMFSAGRMADRGVGREKIFLAGAIFQIPFLIGMGWLVGPALLPMAMGVGFFHFLTQPAANQMVAEFTPPRLRGFGFGLYFFVAFGAGSAGSAIAGWMSRTWDLASVFPGLAVLLAPSILAILAARSFFFKKRETS